MRYKNLLIFGFFFILFQISEGIFGQEKEIDSLNLLIESSKDTTKARLLIKLSDKYRGSNPKKAVDILFEVIEIANNKKNNLLWADANMKLGYLYYDVGNYAISVKYLSNALKVYDDLNNSRGKIESYFGLSLVFEKEEDFDSAINYFEKILTIHKKNKKEKGVGVAYLNIGVVNIVAKRYDTALDYYDLALEIFNKTDDESNQARCYNNLAIIYKETGDTIKAINFYKKAKDLFIKTDDIKAASYSISNIGKTYKDLGEYKKSEEFLFEALSIKKKLNESIEVSQMLINIGDLYREMNNEKESIKKLEEAIKIAKEFEAKNELKLAYESLVKTYLQISDFESAYNYHVKYKLANDSLHNQNSKELIYNLKIGYETEKKDKEIEYLSEQNRLQRIKSIISLIAFILTLILMCLFYNRYRLKRKILSAKKEQAEAKLEEERAIQKQKELESKLKEEEYERRQEELKAQAELTILTNEKLQAELDYSHRELSSSTMYAYQRNEILSKIQDLVSQISPECKELKLKEINRFIKSNIEDTGDWDRLKLHFEKVHPDFFTILHEKYPGLTQNELKHCAYLKIKLSNKEIASLLNVAPKSMQMARYRLKKKMDLGPDEDLVEFIDRI